MGGDYPELFRLAQPNHTSFNKVENISWLWSEGHVTKEGGAEKCTIAGSEDGRREPCTKKYGQPLTAGKGKQFSPRASRKP